MSKHPDLTIVIPAYSEEERIGTTLDELAFFLKTDKLFKNLDVEVFVVVAGAPDNTSKVVAEKERKFRDICLIKPGPRAGKGRDVQFGMLRAQGKFVVYMDADLATPLYHLSEFYKACQSGDDIVIGTRDLSKHHPGLIRRMISIGGNLLFRIAGGVWVEDSQCGFKMFTASASQLCFSRLRIMGWGFDMEILAIAKANHIRTKSIRIDDWRDMPNGTFTGNILVIMSRSLSELGHIIFRRIQKSYTQEKSNA